MAGWGWSGRAALASSANQAPTTVERDECGSGRRLRPTTADGNPPRPVPPPWIVPVPRSTLAACRREWRYDDEQPANHEHTFTDAAGDGGKRGVIALCEAHGPGRSPAPPQRLARSHPCHDARVRAGNPQPSLPAGPTTSTLRMRSASVLSDRQPRDGAPRRDTSGLTMRRSPSCGQRVTRRAVPATSGEHRWEPRAACGDWRCSGCWPVHGPDRHAGVDVDLPQRPAH